jgi:dihydrofolate reductase
MTPPTPSAEVFIATSLDGFIARPDGDIGWLVERPVPAGEDYGYAAFMDGIGAIVMGRQTFDKVLGFPEWPYACPVVVMSRQPSGITVPPALAGRVEVTDAGPAQVLTRLAAQGVTRAYVDGGQIVRLFLAAGLIRRLTVTLIPVLLGQGRPLWGHGAGDIGLRLVAARHWPDGAAQLTFET